MNDNDQPPHLAKVVARGKASGEIGSADIERRARELALIAGRDEDDVRPDDLKRAQAELEGRLSPETGVTHAESIGSMTRDPSEPASFRDGAKPNFFEPDEQEELEHTVRDAVDEAQHDQMIEARKRRET